MHKERGVLFPPLTLSGFSMPLQAAAGILKAPHDPHPRLQ